MEITDHGALDRLARDLHRHPAKRTVVKVLRRRLRQPMPQVRAAVRASALATLPARGGLGRWVASSRIGASIRVSATTVMMTIRGGRNSARRRSDIAAIDRGRVRAPAWGHRSSWHTQTVPAGFFRRPITEDLSGQWQAAAGDAASVAAAELSRG